MPAFQHARRRRPDTVSARHTVPGAPRHAEVQAFIAATFQRHYRAELAEFAPNLVALERDRQIVAAAGWRCAAAERLFLEGYLDAPVEAAVTRLAGHAVARERIVEVGHLASAQPGGSVEVIAVLAPLLERLGFEWVVFTATRELVGMFNRLGLPPLALAPADPARLGPAAQRWGRYYETEPVVVAGRIRMALDRAARDD